MDIITSSELASYLNEPSAAGGDSVDLVVELANGLVTDVIGDDAAANPSAKVRAITFEAAARAYRNPEGYSSETVDDYTYRLPTEARRAGVYLTPTEVSELTQAHLSTPRSHVGWLA